MQRGDGVGRRVLQEGEEFIGFTALPVEGSTLAKPTPYFSSKEHARTKKLLGSNK